LTSGQVVSGENLDRSSIVHEWCAATTFKTCECIIGSRAASQEAYGIEVAETNVIDRL